MNRNLISIVTLSAILALPMVGLAGDVAKNSSMHVAAFSKPAAIDKEQHMYVIEREIPGAGDLTESDLKSISQKSCSVVKDLGPQIEWLHSYVSDDKIFCVYLAPNKEMIYEHAKKGGFPANAVQEIGTIIDPETAE